MNSNRLPSCQTLLVAALLAFPARHALADELFALEDVRGDDDGNGELIYPNRLDLQRGDLDLVSVSAEERKDGVWFVVEFAKLIRSPAGRVTELGQTPLENLARNGFFTFNVDIYVDTDRIAGAGLVETVPGRGVVIDRNYAWEKAIVLTPRPDIARTMLKMYFDDEFEAELRAKKGRVSKDELDQLANRSERRVDDYYFFPTRVRVNGRKVEFNVPVEFLGGVPEKSWGYTVLVTGSNIQQAGSPINVTSNRMPMMTMGVARGITTSDWGIRGDVDAGVPPVIDILAPDPNTQPTVLDNYDTVAGRLASVPGVAPDGNVAVSPTGQALTMEQAARLDTTTGNEADSAPAATEKRAVPARLRTLNQLLEDGLITQAEYDDLRRKILAEL
jgi:C-terminal binding-module, SLH-like, of glucodextranase